MITGSGWQPNEIVTLLFQEDPAVHEDYVLQVQADNNGDIYWDQWAPEEHDLGVRFYLMASDSRSRAQTTFTDGNLQSVAVSPASQSVTQGNDGAYTVTVRVVGNSDPCTIALTVSGVPPNASAAFSGGLNPFTTGNAIVTRTLTITTTATTPADTYSFAVQAQEGANCTSPGGTAVGNGTLIVTDITAPTVASHQPHRCQPNKCRHRELGSGIQR